MIKCLVLLALLAPPDSLGTGAAICNSTQDYLQDAGAGLWIGDADRNPSGPREILIRGKNSIFAPSDPLIVVDGVQIGRFSSIDLKPFENYADGPSVTAPGILPGLQAADIESIEVLRDISATAAYGARGANGVILIRTHRPQVNTDEGRDVRLSSNVGFNLGKGVSHNHYISDIGNSSHTAWKLAGWYRDSRGMAEGSKSRYLGAEASMDTRAHRLIKLGANAIVYAGKASMPDELALGSDRDDDFDDYGASAAMNLRVDISPSLYWKTLVGGDFRNVNRTLWYGSGTVFGAAHAGVASMLSNIQLSYNAQSSLNFERWLFTSHRVEASLGAQVYGGRLFFDRMTGDDFFIEELRGKGLSLMNSAKYLGKYRFASTRVDYMAGLSYAFRSLAGLDLTANLSRNYRYEDAFTVYPGLNLWADLGFLRIEGGAGIAGMEAALPWNYSYFLNPGGPVIDKEGSQYFDAVSLLRSREVHAGLSTRLLDGRLSANARWYLKETDEDFSCYAFGKLGHTYWMPSERETAWSAPSLKVRNTGVELEINAGVLKAKDYALDVSGTFAYNQNIVLSSGYNLRGASTCALIGYRTGEDGNPVDVTRDGHISESDMVVIGSALPILTGTFGISLSLKDFRLECLLRGASGYQLPNMAKMYADGVTALSDRYLDDASYLRLGRISLSYRLPLRSHAVDTVDVFLAGSNLAELTEHKDSWDYPLANAVWTGIMVKF